MTLALALTTLGLLACIPLSVLGFVLYWDRKHQQTPGARARRL